jgi:hypothetical protein
MNLLELTQIYFTIALIVLIFLLLVKEDAFKYFNSEIERHEFVYLEMFHRFWELIAIVIAIFWFPFLILVILNEIFGFTNEQ